MRPHGGTSLQLAEALGAAAGAEAGRVHVQHRAGPVGIGAGHRGLQGRLQLLPELLA